MRRSNTSVLKGRYKMLKNKYYVILGVLALITISTQVAFSQQYSEDRLRVINQLKEKGDDSAIKLAEEYLVSNPNDVDIVNLLAETCISKNDLSKAEVALKKGIAVKPNNPWSRRLLAQVYRIKAEKDKDPNLRSNNLALALEQVKIGLGSNPNDVGLLTEAAQIYNRLGDNIRANEAIDLAITIKPNDATLNAVKASIATSYEWAPEKVKK